MNRYAKPVSLKDIIALDEDDAVAITTREMVERYPLFANGRISIVQGKSIPANDRSSITTIVTLYEVLDIILQDRDNRNAWQLFKRLRPSDDKLAVLREKAMEFWRMMTRSFPELERIRKAPASSAAVGHYRHRNGGHLLFRPVGLLSMARAIKYAERAGFSVANAIELVAQSPMRLTDEPWVGLLWDNVGKKMITRKENQRVTTLLLLHMIGADLKVAKSSDEELKKLYAGALNRSEDQITLPRKINEAV